VIDGVVDYSGLAMLRLEEAISIGIVEATVVLLDLERALDRAPNVPAEGLEHTVAVLVQIPSPVDLVQAATGRAGTACSRLCPEWTIELTAGSRQATSRV
jgi:hypothetical protein